jgi:alkyl sulfatase BDS1-like metallo-beta-lactamase superfamily hydrolase
MESSAQLSTDALILALKTTFDVRAASGLRARYELRLGDDHFIVEIAHGRFQVARGSTEHADVTFETDVATLRALVFARRSLAEAERSGDVRVRGDRRAAAHFTRCFPRPATTRRS